MRSKIVLIFVVIFVPLTAFLFFTLNQSKTIQNKPATQSSSALEPTKTNAELQKNAFADYVEIKSDVVPALPAYTIKSTELTNLKEVEASSKIQIDASKIAALESDGFFVQANLPPKKTNPNDIISLRGSDGRVDDMVDIYSQVAGDTNIAKRSPENAVFITSDLLLHTYHVLIDRAFQNIEEEKLQPALKLLTKMLFEDSIRNYNLYSDPQLKDSFKRLSVFYLVPLSILDTGLLFTKDYFGSPENQDKAIRDDQNADSSENVLKILNTYKNSAPFEIVSLAQKELELVLASNGLGISPLFSTQKPGDQEDYSQYKPRSHYTKNSVLRTYFRSMMWYGRHGFDVKSLELTKDAAIMTHQLTTVYSNEKKALDLWEYIYNPSVFFVGRSDDLSYYDYFNLVLKIFGSNQTIVSFADPTKLQALQSEAYKLAGPKILSQAIQFPQDKIPTKEELLSSTKGFRFMGQRFIPDSYMLSTLTQGNEKPDKETGQYLPSTPTALMVMSILGSKTADTQLDDWIKSNAPSSDRVIAKVINQLKSEFTNFDTSLWTQNIYWGWLYNLLPLFENHQDGYPFFMKTKLWGSKSLLTALGSWTELRHDTLLYAKQSYAEMGGMPDKEDIPPVVKGYVEPNLSFFTRLIALSNMTKLGLHNKDYLSEGFLSKFDAFSNALEFFKDIAQKELANTPISDEDYEKLRTYVPLYFPQIFSPLDGDLMTEKDARMGIIADVHTDIVKSQILYEALGTPSIIYVAVKDTGGTRLTRGAIYSYYEFNEALESRLTDEQWQESIYGGNETFHIPFQVK